MKGSVLAAALVCLMVLVQLNLCLPAMAQDVTPPQIIDATDGTPVTGGNFTVEAIITDDTAVSYVRLYNLYFIIPGGYAQPITYRMFKVGGVYSVSFDVPENAITMRYTVSCNDTSNNWAITDVISRDVEDDELPVANCSALVTLNLGGTAVFNASGSSDNVQVANYTWFMQCGDIAFNLYGAAPTHTFANSGTYTGTLTVRDLWGNADAAAFQVKVLDTEPPVADAGIPVYVNAGFMTFLDGSASIDNEGIANYTWSYIANGTVKSLYGASPPVLFWTPGTYQVTLTVTDHAGNQDTATVTVEVLPGQDQPGGGIAWWVYTLAAMIIIFVILTIAILRM